MDLFSYDSQGEYGFNIQYFITGQLSHGSIGIMHPATALNKMQEKDVVIFQNVKNGKALHEVASIDYAIRYPIIHHAIFFCEYLYMAKSCMEEKREYHQC